jgi:hypothetical protein
MSVQYDPARAKFVRGGGSRGKQRCRRFSSEADAAAFDARVNEHGRAVRRATNPGGRTAALDRVADLTAERGTHDARDGVYRYATNGGVRWRFVYRQSDGTLSSRRGFTSRTAALAARRRLRESIARGEVKVCRETFETFWNRYVAEKRAYMTPGSHPVSPLAPQLAPDAPPRTALTSARELVVCAGEAEHVRREHPRSAALQRGAQATLRVATRRAWCVRAARRRSR